MVAKYAKAFRNTAEFHILPLRPLPWQGGQSTVTTSEGAHWDVPEAVGAGLEPQSELWGEFWNRDHISGLGASGRAFHSDSGWNLQTDHSHQASPTLSKLL